jgi:hypothetical protein
VTTNAWRRLAGALAIVGLLAAPQQPVGAQEVDDLSSLPIEGRDLAVGSESPGELTDADVVWTDDSYVQAWALELERGATVTVDLLSDDFDAYLMVTGPGIAGTLYDDDGAGACNARVTLTASQDGTYRVVVNTISPGSMGRFRLRVTDEPGPVTAGECDIFGEGLDEIGDLDQLLALPLGERILALGEEVRGDLADGDHERWDGSYAQAWGLELEFGEEATVDLRSDDFDSYLLIIGPGMDSPLSDDDGAGRCDSRITFTAREPGLHRIIVNTLSEGETGRFRLSATEKPGPVTEGECDIFGDLDLDMELGGLLETSPVAGRITVGEEVTGELTTGDDLSWDDTYLQVWELELRTGEQASVDLISRDFDAYLMITGPGLSEVLIDDDGAGACDARIVFTAADSGTYRIGVNTISEGEVGAFRLRVTEQPGPQTPGECSEF